MKVRFFLALFVVSGLPLLAEAAGAPRTFRELAADIVAIIGDATATVLTLTLVYFLWNIAKNLTALGHGSPKERNAFLIWGTIILFVMVSIWGILGLLRNTLFQGETRGFSVLEMHSSRV